MLVAGQSHFLQAFFTELLVLRRIPLQEFFLGVPAEHDHIPHLEIKLHMIFLGHDCHFPGHFFEGKIQHILFIQKNGTPARLVGPVDIFEKRRFAAAVRSDQSYELAVLYLQADLFQNAFSAYLIIQIFYL